MGRMVAKLLFAPHPAGIDLFVCSQNKETVLNLLEPLTLIICALVLVFIFMLGSIWLLEKYFVFRPRRANQHWEPIDDPEIEEVHLPCQDGQTIQGWYLPCVNASGVLLYCHGNGGNISYHYETMCAFRQHLNVSVFIFDYPGYGHSSGQPSEQGCYHSATAAYDWLLATKPCARDRIIICGESLGGAVAVDLAARKTASCLVIVRSFTSVPSVAVRRFWWLPAVLLMRNRFSSITKIGHVRCPVFIANMEKDTEIPYTMGLSLYEKSQAPKKMMCLPGHDHSEALPTDFFITLQGFLTDPQAERGQTSDLSSLNWKPH